MHAEGVVRQHSVLRRVLRRFWGRVFGKGSEKGAFFYGFCSKKRGSEKGGFQKVPRAPPRRVRATTPWECSLVVHPRTTSKMSIRICLLSPLAPVSMLGTAGTVLKLPAHLKPVMLKPVGRMSILGEFDLPGVVRGAGKGENGFLLKNPRTGGSARQGGGGGGRGPGGMGREVLHGVGADGVGVKFPIFAVNCCCLPLSFRRRREKRSKKGFRKMREKSGKMRSKKGKNAKQKGKITPTPHLHQPHQEPPKLGGGGGVNDFFFFGAEPCPSFPWKITKKTRIFYPYRTPKIPGKEAKNAQKGKEFLAKKKRKSKHQGVTNVHLSNVHFVLRDISALLDPSWGPSLPTLIHLVWKQ